jgi:hypothetical protein
MPACLKSRVTEPETALQKEKQRADEAQTRLTLVREAIGA